MTIICFIAGLFAGLVLMAYAARTERKYADKQHAEALALAMHELDDAETRIEELRGELTIKQNVIDSQNDRINKQLRIINKRKDNGRTNVQGNTET